MSHWDKLNMNLSLLHLLSLKHKSNRSQLYKTLSRYPANSLRQPSSELYLFHPISSVSMLIVYVQQERLIALCFLHIYNHFNSPEECCKIFSSVQIIPKRFLPICILQSSNWIKSHWHLHVFLFSEKYWVIAVHTILVFSTIILRILYIYTHDYIVIFALALFYFYLTPCSYELVFILQSLISVFNMLQGVQRHLAPFNRIKWDTSPTHAPDTLRKQYSMWVS